jgi:hypothetical protein
MKKIKMGRNIHEENEKLVQSIGQKIAEERLGSIGTPLYIISLYFAPIYI